MKFIENDNPDFYPTPDSLAEKMVQKIKFRGKKIQTILEPSAGKGDLVKFLKEYTKYSDYDSKLYSHKPFQYTDIYCIENDVNLQHILSGNGYSLLDSDFLTFNAQDQFDLIFMNPPFSQGAKHLMKAIDVLYSGQIVCLLNAETLKNPYSNERKDLLKKLNEIRNMNDSLVDIEFLEEEFTNAERKTNVEVALVYIDIVRKVEDDIFKNTSLDADDEELSDDVLETNAITERHNIKHLVAEYNQMKNDGMDFLMNYYKNYKTLSYFFEMKDVPYSSSDSLTDKLKLGTNDFLKKLRKEYWNKALNLPEIKKNLTSSKRDEFHKALQDRAKMEFTVSNVLQFALNLSESYHDTIAEACEKMFDDLTWKHAFDDKRDNVHYYNGWKTNDAYKVNHKVILPNKVREDFGGNLQINYHADSFLDDLDKVASYFDERVLHTPAYTSPTCNASAKEGVTKKIVSSFFIATMYKKGTIHLEWMNEDALRRFNVFIGKRKGWLPDYYGGKSYNDMNEDEKEIVNSFEGKKSYQQNLNQPLLQNNKENLLMISDK